MHWQSLAKLYARHGGNLTLCASLATLSNSWTCASLQEFGKSKIYMPLQNDIELPDKGVSTHCSAIDKHKFQLPTASIPTGDGC